jgi:hypothetical protein
VCTQKCRSIGRVSGGVAWGGVAWRGVAWRGVAWRGVAWRGVAWRGVAWRGVAWRGVMSHVVSDLSGSVISVSAFAAVTGAGVVTDEVAGTEMSSAGAVSFIEGAIGAGFTSLLISFVFSDGVVPAGDATDTVTGASRFGKSDDAVFDTGGVIGADSSSLSVSFAASGSTVSAVAVAAAGVSILVGSATDAVVSKSVRTEMFLDGADLGPDGVVGAGFFYSGVDDNTGASPFSIDSAGSATLDAASVCIGTTAGTIADALVVVGMSSDGAVSFSNDAGGADNAGSAGFPSLDLVSLVFPDTKIAAAAEAVTGAAAGTLVMFKMFSDGVFLSETSK